MTHLLTKEYLPVPPHIYKQAADRRLLSKLSHAAFADASVPEADKVLLTAAEYAACHSLLDDYSVLLGRDLNIIPVSDIKISSHFNGNKDPSEGVKLTCDCR